MNKKYIFIISFLLLLLTIPAISATGSFTDLDNIIAGSGSEVNLDSDSYYIFNNDSDSSLSDGITISKNLTIYGNGATIDGNSTARIFNINGNCTVSLNNINFINGFSGSGSAIYADNTLNLFLNNCTFSHNVAFNEEDDVSGGSIYLNNIKNTVIITNCTFYQNKAKTLSSQTYTRGGAIYSNSNLTLIDSDFIDNSLNGYDGIGGVIYSNGFLNVTGCEFRENNMSSFYGLGGVIDIDLGFNTYISNSNFTQNKISHYNDTINYVMGSVIAHRGNLLEINDCIIADNIIETNIIWWENNTLFNIDGYIIANNNNITNNTSNESFKENHIILSMDNEEIYDFKSVVIDDLVIPDCYDLRKEGLVTPVKDQKGSGSCWAFSVIAALESYLLKYENITYDFSENNLKNVMKKYGTMGYDWDPNTDGGSNPMALAYLLRWSGPVNEADDPYDDTSTTSREDLTVQKYVQDVAFLRKGMNFTDNNEIKKAIMKYGAVSASFYMVQSSPYLNKTTNSYYYDIPSKSANHAIAIVGWNDTYSASNFIITPPGDGAWIIKNSWNTTWGEEGYFYISYYDTTLFESPKLIFTNVGNTSDYINNYQYDPLGNVLLSLGYNNPTAWMKNRFNATDSTPITAVGFYTYGKSDYMIQIYVNDDLKTTQNGTIGYAGFHTVQLDDFVLVNEGETFDVVVKLTTPTSNEPIAVQFQFPEYSSKAHANHLESFISYDGINWNDTSKLSKILCLSDDLYDFTLQNTSLCLKAYCGNYSYIQISELINNTYYTVGDMLNITFNVLNLGGTGDCDVLINLPANIDIISVTSNIGVYNNDTGLWKINDLEKNFNGTLTFLVNFTSDTGAVNVSGKILNLKNRYSNETAVTLDCFELNVSDVVMFYKDGSKLEVSLSKNNNPLIGENITITIIGINYTRITDNSGKAYLSLNLNSDVYDVLVGYKNTTKTVKVTIKSTIIGDDIVKMFRNDTQYNAAFYDFKGNPLADCNVSFNINGIYYTKTTDNNGVARLNINLNQGNYTITAINSLTGELHSNTIIVNSLISDNHDLTKYYKNDSKYSVKILDEKGNPVKEGVTVQFNINGVFYSRITDSEGIAALNINLNPGTYVITAIYNGCMVSNNINVLPILKGEDVSMHYLDGTKYECMLVDSQGKAVSGAVLVFNINGVFYHKTTDENGIARLNINLLPGEYKITAIYKDAMTSNTIKIEI